MKTQLEQEILSTLNALKSSTDQQLRLSRQLVGCTLQLIKMLREDPTKSLPPSEKLEEQLTPLVRLLGGSSASVYEEEFK